MDEDDFDGFYFLCFPSGDKKRVTVIDLMNCVSYERDEWSNVNDNTYYSAEEAIEAGRDIAERFGLEYEPFDSRYGNNSEEANKDGYLY